MNMQLKWSDAPGVISIGIIFVYVFAALFAGHIAPYGQDEIVSARPFEAWNSEFWLGTDQLGRDMFSRLIFGAQNTLGVALSITILAFLIGGAAGILSALSSPWVDELASRFVDVLMAIPQLVFALVLLTVFGSSMASLIVIMGLLDSTRVFRLSRSVARNVKVLDFVQVSELRGERTGWILAHEILPNIAGTLIAEFGLRFCFAFLTIAALSFLGVGIQPPAADWGSMVRENATLITYGDATPLLPAVAIAFLTISINQSIDWYLHKFGGVEDE